MKETLKRITLGELKKTHPEIYKTAYKRHKTATKIDGSKTHWVLSDDDKLSYLFVYFLTPEGDIWYDVEVGKYQPFYDFHGIKNPELL